MQKYFIPTRNPALKLSLILEFNPKMNFQLFQNIEHMDPIRIAFRMIKD